jgi:Dna[CI] antecedent, DciA
MEHAGQGLEKLVVGSLRRAPQGDAPLLAWPLVCGSSVADRTRAVEFASGVLRVEVSDAGWKRELQTLAPRYLATMNRYTGQTVKRIEFVVGRGENAGGGTRATPSQP